MFNGFPYALNSFPLANAISPASTAAGITKTSLLSKINWASLLTNAQKTLNVVNQAIPLYYQVKPVFSNIKTLSKIGKEMNKTPTNNQNNTIQDNTPQNNIINNMQSNSIPNPTFFL